MWDALQLPDNWVGVGPIERVFDATFDDSGHLAGYRWEADIAGRHWTGTARARGGEPAERMRLDLQSSEIRATIDVSLSPDAGGTTMTISIDASSQSMLTGLFWGMIEHAIRSSIGDQAEAFGRRLAG